MYVFRLKSVLLSFFGIVIFILGLNYVLNKPKKIETISNNFQDVIVVDAGHGLPDAGASVDDILESKLNLAIAKKLEDELNNRGYEVIMTRKDENNIADSDKQSSVSLMKSSDLNNRVKIINNSNADFCISIHMNKFTNSKYWGWQTFYNKNSKEGEELAKCIQNNITSVIKKENKRTPLSIEGIKIVDKTNIPVVIVECGFISNPDEAKLLQDELYQQMLVDGICNGVEEFYN